MKCEVGSFIYMQYSKFNDPFFRLGAVFLIRMFLKTVTLFGVRNHWMNKVSDGFAPFLKMMGKYEEGGDCFVEFACPLSSLANRDKQSQAYLFIDGTSVL